MLAVAAAAVVVVLVLSKGGGPQPIAFVDTDGNVATVLADGSELRTLTSDGEDNYYSCLLWSPDGSRLAAVREDGEDDRTELWLFSGAGADSQAIALRGEIRDQGLGCGAWSRDGRYVALMVYEEDWEAGGLEIVDVKKELTQGVPPEGGQEVVTVSAGAKPAEFALTVWEEDSDTVAVYTVRPDDPVLEPLVLKDHRYAQVAIPLFSPSGGRLSYVIYDPDEEEMLAYVAKADGSDAVELSEAGSYTWPMHWCRDGERLLLADQDEEMFYVYDSGSGRTTPLDRFDCGEGAALSPDGMQLACITDNYELAVIDLEQNTQEIIIDDLESLDW